MPDLFIAKEPVSPQTKLTNATHSHAHHAGKPIQARALPSHMQFLSSICQNPQGISFANQEDDEVIVLFIRQHFITNVPWIALAVLLAIFPLVLVPLLPFFSPFAIPQRFVIFFASFYYLIVLGYAFVHFLSWFYNVGIVTNHRIVDIDYSHITHKNIAITRVGDIVDAEFVQGGFFRSLFDFGDIFIQTQGLKPNFEFFAVPHPGKVVNIIIDVKRSDQNAE